MELINNIKKELNGINKSEEYFNNNLKTAIDILYSKYPFIDNKEIDYKSLIRERFYSIKIINNSISHILKTTNDKHNINNDNISYDLDVSKYFILSLLYFNEGINVVYDKYINDNKFLERTYIRVCLLKEGYSFRTIENIINTYYELQKTKYKIDYMIIYTCLTSIIDIYKPKKTNSLGRPKIPDKIKSILMTYKKNKNNERINTYYEFHRRLNNLFFKKEIEYILEGLNNLNISEKEKETLRDKLNILVVYSKK